MFSADNFADFKNALMGLSGPSQEEPAPKKEEPIQVQEQKQPEPTPQAPVAQEKP